MRLLITTDTIGGVWTFTQELAPALLDLGCAVLLVSLGRLPSPDQLAWIHEQSAAWGERFRFVATEFSLEWMDNNTEALAAAALLRELAVEFKAELVHSNQFCFGAGLLCAHALPVVVTAHSDVLSWAHACRGHAFEDSAWLQRYQTLVQSGLSGAAALAAPTQWMLDALRQNFILPDLKVVIPNGRAMRRASVTRQRKLQAVTAGRLWDKGKGIRILQNVSAPMPLLVAGEIEHGTDRLDLQLGHAQLLGAQTHDKLLALFAESAVYICTSLYEPFGLAPLEAALCGCAILARDIATLREVWGGAALYFRDAQELNTLLLQLRASPALLAARQKRSREHARQYSPGRMARAYFELFKQVGDHARMSLHRSTASPQASTYVA